MSGAELRPRTSGMLFGTIGNAQLVRGAKVVFGEQWEEGSRALRAKLVELDLHVDRREVMILADIAGQAHGAPVVEDPYVRRRMMLRWARLLARDYPQWTPGGPAEEAVRAKATAIVERYEAAEAAARAARGRGGRVGRDE